MILNKKRIINLDKYIRNISNTEELYICVPINEKNKEKIEEVYDEGLEFVPEILGPITEFNLLGKEIVNKDKPKEDRIFHRRYHVIDWHGHDHYGTCYQIRECYQRDKILPPLETIIYDKKLIRSNLISIKEKVRLKLVINIFLEIFGYCEILDKNKNSISKDLKIKKVEWDILPRGKYPWNVKNRLKEYFNKIPIKNKEIIKSRSKIISDYNPNFLAIGKSSFRGYIVYGFTKLNIFIFESKEINNATYVFKDEWESVSKLTKKDIIEEEKCYKRIIHDKNWKKEIANLLDGGI